MEQDELNRLRYLLEQLYQQPDLEVHRSISNSLFNGAIEAKNNAENARSAGLWQTLQTLWQRVSTFLTEDDDSNDDSNSGNLAWWQLHYVRTGSDVPVFFPGDTDQVKHWLERIYQVKSAGIDHR